MKKIILVLVLFMVVTLFAIDNFAGNCLDFGGVDDFVSIADDNSLDLNTFTVSLWLKPNGTGGQFIINKGENAITGVGYRIYLDSTTLWADTFVPTRVYSSGTVTIGAWQHIAFTYDGTIQKLYVDGNLVDSDAQSGTLETNDDPLLLGCRLYNSNESDFYEGELDEVRIWNITRSQAEIQDDMNRALGGTETGLVSYWQLNESTGTTASDAVGANDGTLTNMTDDDWVTSTAPVGFPTLSTTIATSITQNSADSGGNVIWEGESNVTARGVCWSTSANPTTAADHTTDGTGTGVFTSNITGLIPLTTYFYRSYAINSVGTGYGDEQSFTTPLSGSGTGYDPYQISTLNELRFLSEHSDLWNSHFVQTANINAAATSGWNSGAGFSPIGFNGNTFTGYYDGAGFTIDGLFINRPSSDNVGLFGYIESADISDLGVTLLNVTGGDEVGGLVGFSHSSFVTNCYSTGSVIGGFYLGGLVGINNDNSTISNCYSTASVSGFEFDSSIAGGLVGENKYYVTNCYSTGNVIGDDTVGGLVGSNSSSTVNNSYSSGSVIVRSEYGCIGGLVGYSGASYVHNSFWDTQTSGQSSSAGGIGKTTAQMQTQLTFTDASWDFIGETTNGTDDHWVIPTNTGYPVLSWQINLMSNFYAVPTEVFIGTEIQFTDVSFGYPTQWQWDFDNDGICDSTEQNPIHSYSTSGTYSVKLTVSNGVYTDSHTKTGYVNVISSISGPENVQVDIVSGDAVISWDEVTEDDEGNPIDTDYYIVLFSENGDDFFYLWMTSELSFTHYGVASNRANMFYQVVTVVNSSSRELTYLQELNDRNEKIKWTEVEQRLNKIKE